jgi:3D (Asp-Asp-Asp) domain-containing protein
MNPLNTMKFMSGSSRFQPVFITLVMLVAIISSCQTGYEKHRMEVTATAYNSHASQTYGDPRVTAWGDTLKPGMKAIAVSRDLIDSGLTSGVKVKIEGLPGKYRVMDKMNRRWTKKIDIYMGEDVEKARQWGKEKVTIEWRTEKKQP